MQVALSANMYDKILQWIKPTQEEIRKISEEYFECSKKYGELHNDQFCELPIVKDQRQMLEFFLHENILDT